MRRRLGQNPARNPTQTNAKGRHQHAVDLLRTGKTLLNHSHAPTSVENARASAGFCQERTIDWPSWDDRLVPKSVMAADKKGSPCGHLLTIIRRVPALKPAKIRTAKLQAVVPCVADGVGQLALGADQGKAGSEQPE